MTDTLTQISNGMPGEPLPYQLQSDSMVTIIMFLCLITVSIIFSRGKKHLLQELKNFTQNRERNSMFDDIVATDARHTIVLILHTCVMLGVSAFYFFSQTTPAILSNVSRPLLLGSLIFLILTFTLIKWSAYCFVNSLFFQKVRNKLWMTAFFNLYIWLGILILPLLLVVIYFDISSQAALFLLAFPLVLTKICLFWKCFSNFFEKIYGSFHLILYFCALEIQPDLILWKGMEFISNNLILNL